LVDGLGLLLGAGLPDGGGLGEAFAEMAGAIAARAQ
jgi:hypothetical protein